MRIEGERIKRTRLIQGGRFVVAVEVEMVIPPDDPSEPCYEAETVRSAQGRGGSRRARDRAWLRRHGKVYELVESA